jgi:hypothetical protein
MTVLPLPSLTVRRILYGKALGNMTPLTMQPVPVGGLPDPNIHVHVSGSSSGSVDVEVNIMGSVFDDVHVGDMVKEAVGAPLLLLSIPGVASIGGVASIPSSSPPPHAARTRASPQLSILEFISEPKCRA